MPKRIDPMVEEWCLQQMLGHAAEYRNPTATIEVVVKRNGVGAETVRRWYVQAQVDSGHCRSVTGEELTEIKVLKAKVRHLGDDVDILRWATVLLAGEIDSRGH